MSAASDVRGNCMLTEKGSEEHFTCRDHPAGKGLSLRHSILGVDDFDRHLGHPPLMLHNLADNLAAELVAGKVQIDALKSRGTERLESRLAVAHVFTGDNIGKDIPDAVKDSTDDRDNILGPAEPRADHYIGSIFLNRLQKARDIAGVMLPVSINRHH